MNPDTPPRTLTLVLTTALSVLSLNMFLPSLANIADDLNVDYSLASLAVAGYLGVTAFLQLIIGPFSDRFGRRPVLLAGIAVFIVASLGCMTAVNIQTFLAFRVLQATAIAGWVLSLAVIRDTSPAYLAASRIGYVSMAMAIGPMVGPMLGGLLDELFGWRSSFLLYAVLGTGVLALCWLDLGETNRHPSASFAAQYAAYPGLLRTGQFWGFALCVAFSTSAFYVFLAGAPMVGEQAAIPPSHLGLFMGSTTAAFAVGSFLSGRYAKRFRLTTMMITGRLTACAGLAAALALVLAGNISTGSLLTATLCLGLGNGLTMPSANAGVMSVKPDLAGSAAGLAGALTVAGGALLTWFTGSILTPTSAAPQLMGIMLFCAAAGLLAALYIALT